QYYEYEIEKIVWTMQLRAQNTWPSDDLILKQDNTWSDSKTGSSKDIFSMKANFDSQGKLFSWTAQMVDISDNAGGGYWTGLFYLREYCTEVVQAVQEGKNITWTNRLWSERDPQYLITDLNYSLYGSNNQGSWPFGRISVSKTPDNWTRDTGGPLYIEDSDKRISGAPYSVAAGAPFSADGGNIGNICSDYNRSCSDGCIENTYCIGNWPIPDGHTIASEAIFGFDSGIGITKLREVFANLYQGWTWEEESGSYKPFSNFGWGLLIDNFNWLTLIGGPFEDRKSNAPQVASVSEVIDNMITINNQEGGPINGTGGSLIVDLDFYAWADANQMPIKNITVDWSGTSLEGMQVNSGKISSKNYKPVCDNLSFGDINDACTDEYLQYQYIYVCGGQDSNGWEADFNGSECSGVCCFKPRVRIQDNWGWCTGEARWCSNETKDKLRCSTGVKRGWPCSVQSDCNPTGIIPTDYKCSDAGDGGGWISYDGIITVSE
ncbi:hypothetical protein IID20_04070, partial [Patescibacteria group bacterium]|nr:hypothetical protein [Patescibacteria group bacterium]